mmetsp:Transcript_69236/g.140769  ORF Transcript_69236/g.140769 Transcript_69236/m.140769 type:complete len:334 (-) Transcript_69236:286-1287(-)
MRSFCMVGHGYQRGLRRNCLPGYRAERVEAEAEDLRPRHRAFQLTLRCADPMPTRDAPGSRLLHKPAPGGVVPLDEAQGPCNVVHFEMQGSLVAAASAALLEVVNPVQALLHAARGQALHVCDGARACQWPLPIHVHHQHLPIGLALVDEADRAQWQAAHHSADTGRCIAKVEHVQRVIVTGGPVELIFQLWVPKGPWEAAVIEGNGPAEGSELLRALGILLDGVLRHVRLHLELLQSAHRHFVDVVEERRGLVQPCLHMEVHMVPHGDARVRRRLVDRDSLRIGSRLVAARVQHLRGARATPQHTTGGSTPQLVHVAPAGLLVDHGRCPAPR